jgi:hypothetical protein
VNLSSIQKAVRGYQNMNGLATGATLTLPTSFASSLTRSHFALLLAFYFWHFKGDTARKN